MTNTPDPTPDPIPEVVASSEPPPSDGDVQPVEMIAICHTEGCPVQDVPYNAWVYPVGTFDPPLYYVFCGRCGQRITDLQPVPPETP